MKLLHRIFSALNALFRRDDFEKTMSDELQFHVEAYRDDLMSAGAAREEATRRALAEFGGVERAKEECREAKGLHILDGVRQDVSYALRSLWRVPAFSLAIVGTIALGIAANTAVFSVLRIVLLRPLPYRESDRIVTLWEKNTERQSRDKVTAGNYLDWQARNHVFDDMAYSWDAAYTLTDSGDPQSLSAWKLSPNFFPLLGTPTLLGRTFVAEDAQPGHDHVAVLSYHLWRKTFSGDRGIVGQSIRLDGDVYTVIGVMPSEFAHPNITTDIWTPLPFPNGLADNRGLHLFQAIARIKPRITISQAQNEMGTLARQSAAEHPKTNSHTSVELEPIRDTYVGNLGPTLWVLQAAVVFMLLIACGNILNMLLARATATEQESAIRLALGAGKWRLLRQFLVQGLVMSGCGAVLGVTLAYWIVGVIPRLVRDQLAALPLPEHLSSWLDWPVLGLAFAIAVMVPLIYAAIPIFRRQISSNEVVKASGRGGIQRAFAIRVRNLLIVAQVALSLVLLIASGLMIRSFLRLQERSLGFETDHVLSFILQFPPNRYSGVPKTSSFLEQMLIRIRTVPGVQFAASISTLPLSGMDARRVFLNRDQPATPDQQQVVQYRVVTPDYFRVMGIPLKTGRFFKDQDRQGSSEVIIINEKLARELWPHDDPIGKFLNVADLQKPEPREVVGVIGDVRHNGLASDAPIEVYRPAYQATWPFVAVVVRTALDDPAEITNDVRQAVWAVDKNLPLNNVRSMESLATDSVSLRRASMLLLAVLAGFAVTLAAVGIYSIVSYTVSLRTHEVGIRLALGANRADVLKTIASRTVMLTFGGLALGSIASLALTHFLASLLFGISPTDSGTLGLAILGMAIVAAGASYFPARRACRIDPMVALRHE